MNRVTRMALREWTRGAALAALMFACAAEAQVSGSVSDYELPPETPEAQGPVDPENPVVVSPGRTPSPRPVPSPTLRPTPIPSPVPAPESPSTTTESEVPASRPSSAGAAPAGEQRPQATREEPATRAEPAEATTAAPSSAPETPSLPTPATKGAPSAETPAAAPTEALQTEPGGAGWPWWLAVLAGLAAVFAAGALYLMRRKSSGREEAVVAETKREPASKPASLPTPGPPAALSPVARRTNTAKPNAPKPSAAKPAATPPIAAKPPAAQPKPRSPARSAILDVQLEPESLRLSLVYATLAYRLALTNRMPATLGPVRIAGDMISAHRSRGNRQQLSLAGQTLEPQHEIERLETGETVSLKGELRLPLSSIVPIRTEKALLFAPLARFRMELNGAQRQAGSQARIFSVGRANGQRNGALLPVRLDLGPRLIEGLAQQEIDIGYWLSLDGARAQR